nr:SEC-C metal-binding domain-containing protein [Burkholderia vietnamiensis]
MRWAVTQREYKTGKPGRNDPCACGSGAKYMHCCIANERRPRLVALGEKCEGCGGQLQADISNELASLMANQEMPLRIFCKENNFYWFSGSAITMEQMFDFIRMLREGRLSVKNVLDAHRSKLTK